VALLLCAPGGLPVFVAASSECFPELSLDGVLQRLVDLEYTAIELAVHEKNGCIKPSEVLADVDSVIAACRETYRLTISGYSIDIEAEGDLYYEQFAACCRLAKATKVVCLTVPAAELGTPFNAEIERLQQLVAIAAREGVLVGLKTETGRITQNPDTAVVLCDNVKGLGLTLDPSHYIYGPHAGGNYDQVFRYVHNIYLRDTTKDKLQVRVGQGEVEYSRLISQLAKFHYNRALVVHISEMEGVDHAAEMRKMRLLLESML
jgi:sugar phosphate isomerase/epimerase